MKRRHLLLAAALCAALPARGQTLKLPPSFDKLAKDATETVEVSLPGPLLRAASGFLSSDDKDEAATKALVANLKGLYVHQFQFGTEDALKGVDADIAGLRDQLVAPLWSRIVATRSKAETVDVYVQRENDDLGGMVILVRDRKELTVVEIDGHIRPEDLRMLSGHFGVPNLDAVQSFQKGMSSKGAGT